MGQFLSNPKRTEFSLYGSRDIEGENWRQREKERAVDKRIDIQYSF